MMCVGLMCDRLRARRPSLPADSSIHHLVGISLDKQGEKAYWLLFPSDAELEDWLEQIAKMMPRPEQPNLGPVPPQMPNTMGQPLPPPGHHVVAPLPGGYQNQPPAYGQPGAPTTIIVQGDQQRGGGMGFAGGMALGALAGYGFGSFFPPAISEVGGPPATPAAAPEAAPDAAAAPPPPDPAVNEPPAAQPETFYLGEESAPVFEQPAEPVGFGGFGGDEYGAFDDGGEF
ncbi:PH domain-containing protein [Aphelenchoides fujianensis]|nr:PH domain-containing protein [Aphelenchoides fujianensis]